MANEKLDNAKKNKIDEFYTQSDDIWRELKHYKDQLHNKVIFCNCDDPYESNFFKYFALNFNHLNLKKLIAISYSGSTIAFTQLSLFDNSVISENNSLNKKAYKIFVLEVSDENSDGAYDLSDVERLIRNKKMYLQN